MVIRKFCSATDFFLLDIGLPVSLTINTASFQIMQIHTHTNTPFFLPVYKMGLLVLPSFCGLLFLWGKKYLYKPNIPILLCAG